MTGLAPLLGAMALVLLGGLFAAIDAAISTVSVARVDELVRDERPGAARLARVMAERPRSRQRCCWWPISTACSGWRGA
jgi:CBS domain containing-hemolysin-like protein